MAAIYEVPISYYGRTYAEGKKISLKDGLIALWLVFRFNLSSSLRSSFRQLPELHHKPNRAASAGAGGAGDQRMNKLEPAGRDLRLLLQATSRSLIRVGNSKRCPKRPTITVGFWEFSRLIWGAIWSK